MLTSVNQDHFPVMLKRSVSMFMVPMTVAVCQAMQETVISLAKVWTVFHIDSSVKIGISIFTSQRG